MQKQYLSITPQVEKALRDGQGVVALESTIISHGMPYPENLECARSVEEQVRKEGAIPATIAILDGKLKVGLSPNELERLAKTENVAKVSRRDVPFLLAKGLPGATTVSATMLIASMAKIRIFATGGIGGVHKGVADTWDISADLEELGRTDVAVVCAGAKSILDIEKTLEFLETKGVPVIGFGTDEFPAFYSRESGCGVDYRFDDPASLAKALKCKWDLGLQGGAVIGVPVPDTFAMDHIKVENIIEKALHDAARLGVRGKLVTPFLLAAVKEKTQGESLKTNIALVQNNARIAARLATSLADLK